MCPCSEAPAKQCLTPTDIMERPANSKLILCVILGSGLYEACRNDNFSTVGLGLIPQDIYLPISPLAPFIMFSCQSPAATAYYKRHL